MGKKKCTKSQPKQVNLLKKSRDSECQTHKNEKQKIVQALKQMNLNNDARGLNDAEHSLLCVKDESRKSAFPKEDSTFGQADNNKTSVNEHHCCKSFLNIPPNLPQSSCKRVRGLTRQYEFNVDLIQAVTCLKSITACVSQLSNKRLQQIFNEQWNTCDNQTENEDSGKEQKQLKCLNVEESILLLPEVNNIQDISMSKALLSNISKSNIIPMIDKELSFNSDLTDCETFDSSAELQIQHSKFDEVTEYITQPVLKNIERTNEEAKNMIDTGQVPGNDFANVPSWEALFMQTSSQNGRYKPTSPIAKQSNEVNDLFQSKPFFNENCITPITQLTQHNAPWPTFDYSPKNLTITPQNNISLISIDLKLDQPEDFNDFLEIGNHLQSFTDVLDDNRITLKTEFNKSDKPNTSVNNVIVQNPTDESTWYNNAVHNYRDGETAKPVVSYDDTRNHYNLRSLKKKKTTVTLVDSSSVAKKSKICIMYDKQASAKKFRRGRPRQWTSAKWSDLESLNVEHVIFESVRVILKTVSDEKTAEEYAVRRYWKDDLIEEAVSAVLNLCDSFRLERKPDICRKPIVTTVTETLDKIVTCVRSNKPYMSQIYRMQIILELCKSVPVSIKIIDFLMARLKSFRSMLNQETVAIQRDMYGTSTNQLYLVFYALNIALRRYRTLVPNNEKTRAVETTIPHVVDLWKIRYVDEECQHAKLDVNDVEERWHTLLKDFMMASTEHFVQFAKKSQSLIQLLNSQQI